MKTLSKTTFSVALAVALFFSSPAAFAEGVNDAFDGTQGNLKGNYFYKQLDNYAVNKKSVIYILERINEKLKKEPDMLPVSYSWAVAMTEVKDSDQVNSLYFMMRSDLAHKIAKSLNRKEENFKGLYKRYGLDALQSILTFEMLLMADTARCKNPGFDPAIISDLLGPRYELLSPYVYSLLPPSEMQTLWSEAMQKEVKLKRRGLNSEICSNAARIGLLLSEEEIKSKIPQPVTPEAISDEEWEVERDRLRYNIRDFWQQRYETRTNIQLKK